MFNMTAVGMKLSELRKKNNMTQLELADKMGVSFQAVSNWERGNSMPDISKLPELADIFGVTIDELYGKKSELINNVVNGKLDEYIRENEVSLEELSEAAPVLKPAQLDNIAKNAKKVSRVDWEKLEELIIFLDREAADEIVMQALDEGAVYDNIDSILPFVSEHVVDKIAEKMVEAGEDFEEVLPFASKETLGELAVRIYKRDGLGAVSDMFPFLSKESLEMLADMEYAKNGLDGEIDALAMFVPKDYLNELAKRSIKEHGIDSISELAPFLDSKLLAEYIKEYLFR